MVEAELQKTVAQFCDFMGYLWFHPANEAKRSVKLASMLKAQGLKSGVPDVCILEPRKDKHGLFIELKVGKNKPTEEQERWLKRLSERGYVVAVCYTAEHAIRIIQEYMNG